MKTIQNLVLALLLTLSSACQNKNNTAMQEIEETIPESWENVPCSPYGHPAEVYEGGLEKRNKNGDILNYSGSNGRLIEGPWGSSGGGMNSASFVPTHLSCTWLSYAENIFYNIDCVINHDKMLKLFQEGYPDSMWFLNDGRRVKSYYNSIITGFAPGGVVVIWLSGAGKQLEIGRYKGIVVEMNPNEKELEEMGYPVRNLFDLKYRKFIMTNAAVVPAEVQKANQGKPIPYGLWDTYRNRYSWRPIFELQDNGVFGTAYFEMINGEKDELFDVSLQENKFTKRAIPKLINMGWVNKTKKEYAAEIVFDEQEVKNAFDAIYKDNKELEAELVFTVNQANNFVTIMLTHDKIKIRLPKTKIKVY